jgi:hypothetical protein
MKENYRVEFGIKEWDWFFLFLLVAFIKYGC